MFIPHPALYLAYNKESINTCRTNEWMKEKENG
jgi:hypothetical protein